MGLEPPEYRLIILGNSLDIFFLEILGKPFNLFSHHAIKPLFRESRHGRNRASKPGNSHAGKKAIHDVVFALWGSIDTVKQLNQDVILDFIQLITVGLEERL